MAVKIFKTCSSPRHLFGWKKCNWKLTTAKKKIIRLLKENTGSGCETEKRPQANLSTSTLPVSDWQVGKKKPKLNLECNLYAGEWVLDDNYPLWTDFSNPIFKFKENCQLHNRTDKEYMKRRWQPQDCDVPRFNASDFRERMAGRRLVYIGDSIAAGSFQSMFAMTANGADYSKIKTSKKTYHSKHRPTVSYTFEDYNFTMEFFSSPTFGAVTQAPNSTHVPQKALKVLHLDRLSPSWAEGAASADVLVFSAGHWFNDRHTVKIGNFPMLNGTVFPGKTFNWNVGFESVMREWAKWAKQQQQQRGSQIFFRAYSPAHTSRTSSRRCPSRHPSSNLSVTPGHRFTAVMKRILAETGHPAVFLDTEHLSELRNDAHIGRATSQPKADCSHWCTPGVPDTWNELLYAELLRRKWPPFHSSLASKPHANLSQTQDSQHKAPTVPDWAIPHFVDSPEAAKARSALSAECDLYQGKWVYDEGYPLWTDFNNKLFDFAGNCPGRGRTDTGYMKMRWQPSACNMPRFDAADFRDRMRGRRMLYVGDSIAKNAYVSMFAMAAHGADHSRIREEMRPSVERVRRKPTTCYFFEEYNFTLEYFRCPNFGEETRAPAGKYSSKVKAVLRLDALSPVWAEPAVGADVMVFSGGHWFNDWHINKFGIFPMLNGTLYEADFNWNVGFESVMRKWAKWAKQQQERGSQIFFRAYSPAHGPRDPRPCPSLHATFDDSPIESHRFTKVMKNILEQSSDSAVFMDITSLSGQRNDAHTGSASTSKRADCSHWCTPGVPDIWNELVYAELLRKKKGPFS